MRDVSPSVDPLDSRREVQHPESHHENHHRDFDTGRSIYSVDQVHTQTVTSALVHDAPDRSSTAATATATGAGDSERQKQGSTAGDVASTSQDPYEHKGKIAKVYGILKEDDGFRVVYLFAQVFVKIFIIYVGIVSIYWGSMYNRTTRYVNLTTLVVIGDDSFQNPNDGSTVAPLIGNTFTDMVTNNKTVSSQLGWKIRPISEIQEEATKHNNTIEEEITEQVHHEKYWAAFFVKPNATQSYLQAMIDANSTFANATASHLIEVIFEEGRHYSSLTQYVLKHIMAAQQVWVNYYTADNVMSPLVSLLTTEQKTKLVSSNTTALLLNTQPTFNILDNSKNLIASMLGPTQLGLIYAQIFSFHQFNFSIQIHQYLKDRLIFKHYMVYRLLSSQINYLVLALVYGLTTLAFQIPTSHAFGKSGFLVFWMFIYLFISASGGISENAVLLLNLFDQKNYIPVWMVFYVMINISPTFSALELCPQFYRFGYAMPMYNVFQSLKVVFFNTWKGNLGRNLGVLVAWIVLTNILLVFNVRYCSRVEKERAAKAEEKKAEEARAKLEADYPHDGQQDTEKDEAQQERLRAATAFSTGADSAHHHVAG